MARSPSPDDWDVQSTRGTALIACGGLMVQADADILYAA